MSGLRKYDPFCKFSYLLPWLALAWAWFYLGQITSSFGLLANQPQNYIAPKIVGGHRGIGDVVTL